MDDKLTEENLPFILQKVRPVSKHWFAVGISLGVPKHMLDEIECDYHGVDRQLTEMLDVWIKMGSEDCTWQTLVSALVNLDLGAAAQSIASCFAEDLESGEVKRGRDVSNIMEEHERTEETNVGGEKGVVSRFPGAMIGPGVIPCSYGSLPFAGYEKETVTVTFSSNSGTHWKSKSDK